eukprot:3510478-Rhodomonas_salina.1
MGDHSLWDEGRLDGSDSTPFSDALPAHVTHPRAVDWQRMRVAAISVLLLVAVGAIVLVASFDRGLDSTGETSLLLKWGHLSYTTAQGRPLGQDPLHARQSSSPLSA